MIIVMQPKTPKDKIDAFINEIEGKNVKVHPIVGEELTVLGLIGDTTELSDDFFTVREIVAKVMHVQEPFKMANKMFHPEPTQVDVLGKKIGVDSVAIFAGPCSVESEEQIVEIAKSVKASGATFLRGGAYKPRSSPYSFQGLGLEGLELLKIAKQETGLPIVSEILSKDMIDDFVDSVDVIQVGARNMQNFVLLRELGKINKPILLKRGLSATIEEWLMSAEYIMHGGNENVILCERGIRTFETYTRNTLDLSAVLSVKKLSHLPIIVDPSHGTGLWWMVEPLSLAAVAAGADGVMIEVHNCPEKALSDGPQSITPSMFDDIMKSIKSIADVKGKIIL